MIARACRPDFHLSGRVEDKTNLAQRLPSAFNIGEQCAGAGCFEACHVDMQVAQLCGQVHRSLRKRAVGHLAHTVPGMIALAVFILRARR